MLLIDVLAQFFKALFMNRSQETAIIIKQMLSECELRINPLLCDLENIIQERKHSPKWLIISTVRLIIFSGTQTFPKSTGRPKMYVY